MPPTQRKPSSSAPTPVGTDADKPADTTETATPNPGPAPTQGGRPVEPPAEIRDPAPDDNSTPEGAPGDVTAEDEDTGPGYSSEGHYQTVWGIRTFTRDEVDRIRKEYPSMPFDPIESLPPGVNPVDHIAEARTSAELATGEKLPAGGGTTDKPNQGA
jgi:hypothetical protein